MITTENVRCNNGGMGAWSGSRAVRRLVRAEAVKVICSVHLLRAPAQCYQIKKP